MIIADASMILSKSMTAKIRVTYTFNSADQFQQAGKHQVTDALFTALFIVELSLPTLI